jgi:hypothetical protein
MSGFITLHRRLLDWEWYSDINTKTLFIHCLLKANWEDKNWKGIDVKRGSFITSYDGLSKETKLTVQQIRTAIFKLTKTQEVNIQTTNKYTLLTVVKYEDYQGLENKPTSKQQTNNTQPNKQTTTTNNITNKPLEQLTTNNNDYISKKEIFNFKKKLIDYGFDENLVSDWMQVRKNKKATNTETSFKKFIAQIELSKEDKNELLKFIIEKDWKGFEYQWLINLQNEFKKQQENGKQREQPLFGRQTADTFLANTTGWFDSE